MPDDLFTPTITEAPVSASPPWRVDSLVYPAFIGGPLAVTVLAVVNAGRLGVHGRKVSLLAAAGAAAFAAEIVAILLLGDKASGAHRFMMAIAGVAVWGVVRMVLLRPFRAFQLRGDEPASLWGAGIAAVFGLGFLHNALIYLVTKVVAG